MDHAIPAPQLTQHDDEEALLAIGEILFPGSLTREGWEPSGIYVWIEGDPTNIEFRQQAALRHQCVLGVLRAWWDDAGELSTERLTGLGPGSSRNRDGAQWIAVPSIVTRPGDTDELRAFAQRARAGISVGKHLDTALAIHGRANRFSADYRLIHELAMLEFATGPERSREARVPGGRKVRGAPALLKLQAELGVAALDQVAFMDSADNLPPLQGGRHASPRQIPAMSLDEQRVFIAGLLKRWIEKYG
jgi:hypothetical protein